jgi:hypothetical protein
MRFHPNQQDENRLREAIAGCAKTDQHENELRDSRSGDLGVALAAV